MTHKTIALGVNIDHVATLRQARRGRYPDPVHAALAAEMAGADSITLHLREDRRHIQDQDVRTARALLKTHMNLEMAVTDEMIDIARAVRPSDCCLVPEKRQEITTEGGLDVAGQLQRIKEATAVLKGQGIRVSLFIDPDPPQIEAGRAAGRQRRSWSCIRAPRLRRIPPAPARLPSSNGCVPERTWHRAWGWSFTPATDCTITTCSRSPPSPRLSNSTSDTPSSPGRYSTDWPYPYAR